MNDWRTAAAWVLEQCAKGLRDDGDRCLRLESWDMEHDEIKRGIRRAKGR